MKYLWINRSSKPHIVSLSEFFLSLATGKSSFNEIYWAYDHSRGLFRSTLFNVQILLKYSVILITLSLLKLIYFSVFQLVTSRDKKQKDQKQSAKILTGCKLAYPGLIKAGIYLSVVTLITTIRNLSTAIIIALILTLSLWLNFCSTDSKIVQILLKGRNYSQDKIKSSILYALLLGSIFLEPQDYVFYFQLHFEIFFIFTSVLLIFSYFYIHKLVLKCSFKEKSLAILLWQSLFQTLFLLLAVLYLVLMDSSGLTLDDQFDNLLDNWWVVLLISIFNTFFQLFLWEHLKKVAFSQLLITLSTGLFWFNIYSMSATQIDPKLYISVITMLAVLLVNIGIISWDNLKYLQRWLKKKEERKTKFRQFQNQKEMNEIDQ